MSKMALNPFCDETLHFYLQSKGFLNVYTYALTPNEISQEIENFLATWCMTKSDVTDPIYRQIAQQVGKCSCLAE